MTSMTFNEFMQRVLDAFPDAYVEPDIDCQLVVHTGLRLNEDDTITPMPEEID